MRLRFEKKELTAIPSKNHRSSTNKTKAEWEKKLKKQLAMGTSKCLNWMESLGVLCPSCDSCVIFRVHNSNVCVMVTNITDLSPFFRAEIACKSDQLTFYHYYFNEIPCSFFPLFILVCSWNFNFSAHDLQARTRTHMYVAIHSSFRTKFMQTIKFVWQITVAMAHFLYVWNERASPLVFNLLVSLKFSPG